jgi:hypothetical protein
LRIVLERAARADKLSAALIVDQNALLMSRSRLSEPHSIMHSSKVEKCFTRCNALRIGPALAYGHHDA